MNLKAVDSFLNNVMVAMIIIGFALLILFLLTFISNYSDSNIKILNPSGIVSTYITNPYQYYSNIDGIIYTMVFGISGGIMIYIFLFSSTFSMMTDQQQKEWRKGKTPITGAQQLHVIPEDVADANALVMNITSQGSIQPSMIKNFLRDHLDIALKFTFRKTLENKPLDQETLMLFMQWENNGLNKQMFINEIQKLLNLNKLGKEPPLGPLRKSMTDAFILEQKIREKLAIH